MNAHSSATEIQMALCLRGDCGDLAGRSPQRKLAGKRFLTTAERSGRTAGGGRPTNGGDSWPVRPRTRRDRATRVLRPQWLTRQMQHLGPKRMRWRWHFGVSVADPGHQLQRWKLYSAWKWRERKQADRVHACSVTAFKRSLTCASSLVSIDLFFSCFVLRMCYWCSDWTV